MSSAGTGAPAPSGAAPGSGAAAGGGPAQLGGGGGRSGPPNYHRLERLGKGSFATVYRAVHVHTNQEAAIKHISQERLTVKLQENLESEISILKNHAHRNIVRLYDIERNDRHIYIVLEYCRGGDLQRFIKGQPRGRLSEATARHFMRHLAAGLKFLNDRNLVHRDIKPQNLLLTEPSERAVLKIADFGFARHLEGTSMAETLCGSPLYMAPEILGQNQYNAKADLWSTGAVLFEMVAGRPPFAAQSQVELLKVIRRPLQIPPDVELSRPCLALLQALLKREPVERVSFEDFFKDPFLDMKGSGFLDAGEAEEDEEEEQGAGAGGQQQPQQQQERAQAAATTPRGAGMPLASRRLTSIQEAPEPPPPQQQHAQQQRHAAPMLHRADSGSRRSSSLGAAPLLPPPPPFGMGDAGDDDGHDSGLGLGGGSGRHSSSTSSLPFHAPAPAASSGSRAIGTSTTAVPSPRVNPFKPLAASPPGAVAVSSAQQQQQQQQQQQHGRHPGGSASSSSSSSASSRRGAAGHQGGDGVGEGSESLESDGFVIVNAVSHMDSPRGGGGAGGGSHGAPVTPSRSASVTMGTQTGPGSLPPAPPAARGWGGGLAVGRAKSASSSSSTSSSSSSSGGGVGVVPASSRDSVDGALRALAYLEASTRRAILIASLGDAKAMAALNHRQRAREAAEQEEGKGEGAAGVEGGEEDDDAGVGGLMQGLGLGGLGLGLRKPPEWTGSPAKASSPQQQQRHKAVEAEEAKAAALLVDALVLYLKALSVVGTGIKALRQVMDVIHTHLGASTSASASGAGTGGHWRAAASSGSLDASGGGGVHERIAALRDWLELHFSIMLDRAQECRLQIDGGGGGGGGTTGASGSGEGGPGLLRASSSSLSSASASAFLGSAGAGHGAPLAATRSAEELLYKHALSLAKEGAVKELVGQRQGAVEYYAQARLTMEALLAEPLLPHADQQLLERYVDELAASCARLAAAPVASASVTAAAVTFGGGGGGAGGEGRA